MPSLPIALSPDVATCDREPIHIPGSIQPHGYLLALDALSLVIRHASENVARLLNTPLDGVLGRSLAGIFGEMVAADISAAAKNPQLNERAIYLRKIDIVAGESTRVLNAIGHCRDGLLILELEPSTAEEDLSFLHVQPLVESFIAQLGSLQSIGELSELAAREVRQITGFDRVLIYQFDEEWNGLVIAEDRNERLPSYLDLRFPASDIPKQARELYRVNRQRIIADASYSPVRILPTKQVGTGNGLDLTLSMLRSVSPVHVQYMKNMGTASSMSVSILQDGRLWGLISCHHKTAKTVPFEVRTACDFLGQVFALQIASKEHASTNEYRVRLKGVLSRLLAYMSRAEGFVDGLTSHPSDVLELTAAHGAAVVADGNCMLIGETPAKNEIQQIVEFLTANVTDEVFSTDTLSKVLPQATAYKDKASGLLSVSISPHHRSYILWFRPEVIQTVKWGGDPRKPTEAAAGEKLNPRKSFEIWKETVRLKSLGWQKAETETAAELRNIILGIVLKKAEELADLSRELERSNKELEAFSYSVSHDLRAPFRHIVGYAEILRESKAQQLDDDGRRYIETIIESALFAGTLVDNLLAFSQMGRAALDLSMVNSRQLFDEVKNDLLLEIADRQIEWKIKDLPDVWADPMMLKLVVRNLLANAVKYTRHAKRAVIEIASGTSAGQTTFQIRDNGTGFDMRYVDKLFGVFQRLHRMEEFEGTGIGLANVRRIITRHGGETWAEGEVGKGATFYFSLPDPKASSEVR